MDNLFKWEEKEQVFNKLKKEFSEAPLLAQYNLKKSCVVETNLSDFITSGILLQLDNKGHLYPVAFISAKMTPAKCNYGIEDKELLTIVKVFKVWRAYLKGNPFQIRVLSDHANLQIFTSTKKLNRQ